MQMQPQPQQANSVQATQAAMQQAKQVPQQGEMPQEGQEQGGEQDNFSQEIIENLQDHLNNIDDKQKQFVASALQHYANIVIPFVGIICGQEVMDYFLNIYKQNFAKGLGNKAQQPNPQQQQNSAPNPAQGQQPNQAPQQQAQAPQQQVPAQQPQ